MDNWLMSCNKIFQAVFGRDNPYDLAELERKFAFDIQLPTKVCDTTTGAETYTALPNAQSFIMDANVSKRNTETGWLLPKRTPRDLAELIEIWQSVNLTTTERVYDSMNVVQSDPIYNSTNVYKSTNCGNCKDIYFCDGTYDSNFSLACQRSTGLNFCIRVDDSNACTNSYSVICSGKVSNSLFIQDASELHECLFCSHLSNRSFCVANMQFTEAEYFALRTQIIKWLLG